MLKSWYEQHPGKFVASVIGLLFAIIYLFFGFWDMLFVGLLLLVAFQVGRKFDAKTLEVDLLRYVRWLSERFKLFR